MKLLMTTALIAMTAISANAATLEEFCAATEKNAKSLAISRSSGIEQAELLAYIRTDDSRIRNYWANVINEIYASDMNMYEAKDFAYKHCIETFGE